MSDGYIQSFRLDESTLCAAWCKAQAGKTYADSYDLNLERTIFELIEYYQDCLVDEDDDARETAHAHLNFKKPGMPSGPYHVTASLSERHEDKNDYAGDYTVVFKQLSLSLASEFAGESFYTMSFTLQQLSNSLNRYRQYTQGPYYLKNLSKHNIEDLIYGDLMREEGHEGIIARLFPLQFNKNIEWSKKLGRDYTIDFRLACRLFSVIEALFPRGPYTDVRYGLVATTPENDKGWRKTYMGKQLNS